MAEMTPHIDFRVRHRLPAVLSKNTAESLLVKRAPGSTCVDTRLVHHPYAGFVYVVEQRVFGSRLRGIAHVLVDLATGATATSDPWLDPKGVAAGEDIETLVEPNVTHAEAQVNARQCAVRTALHRRRALIPLDVELTDSYAVLLKPNWLVQLVLPNAGGRVDVLVDALNGGYHLMPSRPVPVV